MSLTILVVIVVAVLATVFVVMNRRDYMLPTAEREVPGDANGVVSEPVPVNVAASGSEPDRITWTKEFDASFGDLDDDARLCLIEDLGLLRAEWCIPLLKRALREETDPKHRAAAQRALALYTSAKHDRDDDQR
jgi:hypothetical protein